MAALPVVVALCLLAVARRLRARVARSLSQLGRPALVRQVLCSYSRRLANRGQNCRLLLPVTHSCWLVRVLPAVPPLCELVILQQPGVM